MFGLSQATTATSAATCLAAACASGVPLWQWCPGGLACGTGASCWIGSYPGTSQDKAQAGWVSGLSNVSSSALLATVAALNDTAWSVLDLPHDFEVGGQFSSSNNGGEGFLPYNVAFYRKHLAIPPAWNGSHIELYVQGALSASTWWLNGLPLAGGAIFSSSYTALILRLDDSPGLLWGAGAVNVVTAYVDGTAKTGWWYEGGGLYRRVLLTSSSAVGGVVTHGISAPANVTGAPAWHTSGVTAAGSFGAAALSPSATLRNDGPTPSSFFVTWSLVDATGAVAASATSLATSIPPFGNATATLATPLALPAAELWSVARPYLYTLVTSVAPAATGAGVLVDSVNTTVGIRSAVWSASTGFSLNGAAVKMRGFCNHENFGALGAAMYPRVDLLRVQQLRGVGGNAWRTSHNAPEPWLLDITDRLGVLVMVRKGGRKVKGAFLLTRLSVSDSSTHSLVSHYFYVPVRVFTGRKSRLCNHGHVPRLSQRARLHRQPGAGHGGLGVPR